MSSVDLQDANQLSNIQYLIGEGGVGIPIRRYGVEGNFTPVVLLHGLQSHSGWFVQSCSFLARCGFPVYAVDRRGSGLSEEPRGDCRDFQEMVADISTVVEHAKTAHKVNKVHVFGHCFGAMPATAFACAKPEIVESLILATPGLFTKDELRLAQKLKILGARVARRQVRIPAPLEPEVFSELDEYVQFIREDEVALKSVTASLFFEILRMRRFIARYASRLDMPLIMFCAGQDEICDNTRNRRFFGELSSNRKSLIEYERTKHVLEFGVQKDEFFGDLEWWLDQWKQDTQNGSGGNSH